MSYEMRLDLTNVMIADFVYLGRIVFTASTWFEST